MRKLILFLSIFSSLFVSTYRLYAQSGSLAVTQIYNFPPLIFEGFPYDSIIVVVTNTDSVNNYQGSISIEMFADSSSNAMLLSSGIFSPLMAPGDTVAITINNYFFDPAGFKEGQNIVVVWPIGNVTDVDSFYTSTYYVHATAVEDLLSEKDLSVTPNPAREYLYINYDSSINLEQVRIYAVNGKLISHKLNENKIDISPLAPGVYYVYFLHRKGVSIRKLIKY